MGEQEEADVNARIRDLPVRNGAVRILFSLEVQLGLLADVGHDRIHRSLRGLRVPAGRILAPPPQNKLEKVETSRKGKNK